MTKARSGRLERNCEPTGDTDQQPGRTVGAEHGPESGDERRVDQRDRAGQNRPYEKSV